MGDWQDRITHNPRVLGGKPLIRGMRISVELVLELLERGASEAEILQDYPQLELDDIRAAIAYARRLVAGEQVHEIRSSA
ncbi:MAG: hypothetical protein AMXMBFR13_22740 [Phycisphaerae bacterium]